MPGALPVCCNNVPVDAMAVPVVTGTGAVELPDAVCSDSAA